MLCKILLSIILNEWTSYRHRAVCAYYTLCLQDALQQRMAVQESSVLQLKQEVLRASMSRDELAGQNVSVLASARVCRMYLRRCVLCISVCGSQYVFIAPQAELHKKLEERNRLLSEYKVP